MCAVSPAWRGKVKTSKSFLTSETSETFSSFVPDSRIKAEPGSDPGPGPGPGLPGIASFCLFLLLQTSSHRPDCSFSGSESNPPPGCCWNPSQLFLPQLAQVGRTELRGLLLWKGRSSPGTETCNYQLSAGEFRTSFTCQLENQQRRHDKYNFIYFTLKRF